MEEVWQDIEGFEGIYQESNLGNVRSLKVISPQKDGNGIYILHKNKRRVTYKPKVLRQYVENLPNEEWRVIDGYDGWYSVSNLGRVKHKVRGPIENGESLYKQHTVARKYKGVYLKSNGRRVYCLVHRLVAMCFIPNPNNYPFVNHKDENPENNKVDNLEWCTHLYNVRYGTGIARKEAKLVKLNKRVLQYTKDGKFVKEWYSVSAAARAIGLHISGICKAAKHKINSCGGYIWEYA